VRRHPHDPLTGRDQRLLEPARDVPAVVDRPHTLIIEPASPAHRGQIPLLNGLDLAGAALSARPRVDGPAGPRTNRSGRTSPHRPEPSSQRRPRLLQTAGTAPSATITAASLSEHHAARREDQSIPRYSTTWSPLRGLRLQTSSVCGEALPPGALLHDIPCGRGSRVVCRSNPARAARCRWRARRSWEELPRCVSDARGRIMAELLLDAAGRRAARADLGVDRSRTRRGPRRAGRADRALERASSCRRGPRDRRRRDARGIRPRESSSARDQDLGSTGSRGR
jgi:hypothetical protein